jgi:GAF domain-containing protein
VTRAPEDHRSRPALLRVARLLADTLHDDFDVAGHLTALAGHAVAILGAADAGVLVEGDQGDLAVVATTSHEIGSLKVHQAQLQQGPCVEAMRSSTVVHISDLAADDRWPAYSREACGFGYRSAIAVPLLMRDGPLGAINVLWRDEAVSVDAVHVIEGLAEIAGLGIRNADELRQSTSHVVGLRSALASAQAIESAKAVLAEALSIPLDEAYQRLRRRARDRNQKVAEAARQVVAGDEPPSTFVG